MLLFKAALRLDETLHIDLGDRGHQLRVFDSAVEREAHGDPFDDAVGVAAVVELQRQEELRALLGPSCPRQDHVAAQHLGAEFKGLRLAER